MMVGVRNAPRFALYCFEDADSEEVNYNLLCTGNDLSDTDCLALVHLHERPSRRDRSEVAIRDASPRLS